MKAVFYILLAGLLTYSSCYVMGAFLLRWLRISCSQSAERFLAFISGSALLSTLVFLMTAAGLARKGAFLAVTLPLIAAGLWQRVYRPTGEVKPKAALPWRIGFWMIFALFSWYYLPNSLTPETSPDGVMYHVGLPVRYLREHHFPHITTNMYANLSAGIEMLFEYAISIGRYSAAGFTHFLFLIALTLGIVSYGRDIGRPRAGLIAALLIYLSPVIGRDATVGYIDVAAAAVAFGLFYAVQLWRDNPTVRGAALVGLLAGFGFAVKYPLFIGVFYALAMIVWTLRKHWRMAIQYAVIAGLCAFAVMSPWLIKNTIYAGNPFSPFMNRWFPNPYVYAAFERDYVESFRHMSGVKLSEIPWEAMVNGERLSGLIGPIFLLLPIALLALRNRYGRQLLLASVVFLIPYFGNIGVRFLFPMLPFAALALALTVDQFRFVAPFVVLAHALFSWPTNITTYSGPYVWRIERPNWDAALRRVSEEEYLTSNRDDYTMAREMERVVPKDEAIFSPATANQTYHSRHLLGPFESTLGNRIYDMMFRVTSADMRTTLRNTYKFAPGSYRRLRVVLTNADPMPLNISEIRLWNGGQEIPRSAQWKLRSSDNPWDLQLAFDNSPVTTWNPGDATRVGMYVEIDFGAPLAVDAVTADIPQNQAWGAMRIDGERGGSGWSTLTATGTRDTIPWPPLMRRQVMQELKAAGVHWLVFRDGELLSDDLIFRSKQWGITLAAYRDRCRLWHLD